MSGEWSEAEIAEYVARIPQGLPGGVFIYTADEAEQLLYASEYVIQLFGCETYDEFAAYVGHSFRGMVYEADLETVEKEITAQIGTDVAKLDYVRYRIVMKDGTIRYVEDFGRYVELPGKTPVFYIFLVDYDRKYLSGDVDAMTGLPGNRRFLQYINDLKRKKGSLDGYAMVYFNLVNFKLINIRYGVANGDASLVKIRTILQSVFPDGFLSRRRNDHFILFVPQTDIAERLQKTYDLVFHLYEESKLDLKAGFYVLTGRKTDPQLVLDYAHAACSHIRNDVSCSVMEYTDELQSLLKTDAYIAEQFEEALRQGCIRAYYQPIIRGLTGAVCGMETLARWDDPQAGFLSPGRFIPILERNHDIHKLDMYILRCTCRNLRRRLNQDLPVVPVSFNLSRLDFFLCDIFQAVEDIVAEYSIPKDLIYLEITETMLVDDRAYIRETADRFRRAGYHIMMDDFGSGYSSLNVFKDYDFDIVKLDMKFLSSSTPKARRVLEKTVDLIKCSGSQCLAEGVETPEEAEALTAMGCNKLQGYLYSKPCPWDDVFTAMASQKRPMERAAERDYYNKADDFIRQSDQPLAMVEYDGQNFHHYYLNCSYLKELASFGHADVIKAEKENNHEGQPLHDYFQELMGTLREKGRLETLFHTEAGYYIQLTAAMITVTPARCMIRTSLHNLSGDKMVQAHGSLTEDLQNLYRLYDSVHLIDLKDLTALPLYLRPNSLPDEVMCRGEHADRLARQYGETNIHPDDRERFLAFTDFSTMKDRLQHGALSSCFRIRDIDQPEQYLREEIIYLPLAESAGRMALCCMRSVLCCPDCQEKEAT